jgi:hypothetical protein
MSLQTAKSQSMTSPGRALSLLFLSGITLFGAATIADSTQARCEIYTDGADKPDSILPCVFSQRQGYINIDRNDGISLDLEPQSDAPGSFIDQNGRKVKRRLPVDENGQIFHTDNEILRVYWTWVSVREKTRSGEIFDQTFVFQGVSFRVSSPNNSSLSPVRIEAIGPALEQSILEFEADGVIVGAEVADLDANGSPELYIYTASAGSGSYGGLIAIAVNSGKSLSDVYLPPLTGEDVATFGYMGHDQFAVVENTLVRRFPVYESGDTNANPTGGTVQLQYKLEAGEAGWILRLDKIIDY